ncbi:DNA cytosine methyltransferase [Chlorogloeopsis fritschii PCC 6912]|uniref:DNA (cytosine-5-)-methyltransferase n=1 Tax=Chlorogloeopsis fritschii PCC 6912 TaxID=211165 RepID=A0A3S0ZL26_CHLFR|nr:DNA (cytosine-5-)-methyltransferase [Chlorogloeopsis fritschii]RUR74901.1 DNA cytosine methyltransferase [Chlorogloeopsis fritschii PCC 6912]
MKKYALVYFSGAGGTSLGAIAAGYKTIGIEIDAAIASLYKTNCGEVVVGDVTTIDPASLAPSPEERRREGSYLVWQISPPCQEFSRANNNQDKTSVRATILENITKHLKILLPDFVWLENVPEYCYSPAYINFCNSLRSLNYSLSHQIVNAADFGVPQSRKRLIMIAAKQGWGVPLLTPTHTQFPLPQLFGDNFLPWVGWYEAIKDLILELPKSELTEKQKAAIADYPHQNLLVERIGYYEKPKVALSSLPCWTLRASLGDDGKGGDRTKVIDVVLSDGDVRSLNNRSLARLQSFPDWYQWSGKASVDIRGIGNSVPPLLSQKIFEVINLSVSIDKEVLVGA